MRQLAKHVLRTARGIGPTSIASRSEPCLTAVATKPFNRLFSTVKANHVLSLTAQTMYGKERPRTAISYWPLIERYRVDWADRHAPLQLQWARKISALVDAKVSRRS